MTIENSFFGDGVTTFLCTATVFRSYLETSSQSSQNLTPWNACHADSVKKLEKRLWTVDGDWTRKMSDWPLFVRRIYEFILILNSLPFFISALVSGFKSFINAFFFSFFFSEHNGTPAHKLLATQFKLSGRGLAWLSAAHQWVRTSVGRILIFFNIHRVRY